MVAPRGLLIVENTDYQWLGVNSVATSATAAQMIFQGLGVPDNIGFSNSSHVPDVVPSGQPRDGIARPRTTAGRATKAASARRTFGKSLIPTSSPAA